MQKIVLNHSNVGLIVGRLQKLMKDNVVVSQRIYNEKPSQVKRSKVFSNTSYSCHLFDSKVTRHWFSFEGEYPFASSDRKTPLVHISIHSDSGMVFSEGDVFYFYGPMVLIDKKNFIEKADRVVYKLNFVQKPTANLINKIRAEYREQEAYAAEYWKRYDEDREEEFWEEFSELEEEDFFQDDFDSNEC